MIVSTKGQGQSQGSGSVIELRPMNQQVIVWFPVRAPLVKDGARPRACEVPVGILYGCNFQINHTPLLLTALCWEWSFYKEMHRAGAQRESFEREMHLDWDVTDKYHTEPQMQLNIWFFWGAGGKEKPQHINMVKMRMQNNTKNHKKLYHILYTPSEECRLF